MHELEKKALYTYQKNIKYFTKEHKNLSNILNIFERALSTGDYTPLYDLEYVNDNFDIKNINSLNYLYNKDSSIITKNIVKSVDFSKQHYIFEGFPVYNFSKKSLMNASEEIKFIDGVFPLMRYYSQNFKESDFMKKIEKFIFVGVGLGTHIQDIHKKISAKHYMIVEDNLEIFRLSLFITEYYEIAKSSELYFSIADNENMFLKTFHDFLDTDFLDNRYLKYHHLFTHSNNKIKQIQNALTTQAFIFFPYKAELYKFLRPLEYINDGYNIINLITNLKMSMFNDKPVLVIGAGPSFKTYINWLEQNHTKFIIIAASAVINTLYKHNIKPDIITHLDGSIEGTAHFNEIKGKSFLENTIMFFGANTRKELRELFSKEQMFYYEEGAGYFEGFGSISTPCVGSFTIMLSLLFNVKETYLLGLDLALNQETGETHSNEHLYSKKNDMKHKDELKNIMGNQENIFPVQGNFTDKVYTNSLLHASIQSLYKLLPEVKQDEQTIYNLNDGAKINKTIPKHVYEIDTVKYSDINKKDFFKEIKIILTNNSTKSLSVTDVMSIKQRLINAKKVRKIIESYINNVSHTNSDKYLYDMLGMVSTIFHMHDRESGNLTQVYLGYFKYALAIIADMFNTKGLKNEKKHIKKVDKMIQDEILDICDIYIKELDDFIKNRC